MSKMLAVAGGLAGAGALTAVHEITKRVSPNAPRMDLLAMNGLAKILRSTNGFVPSHGTLFGISLAGDLVSNALYYSLAGTGSKKSVWIRGALLGLGAGVSAIYLPGKMNMPNQYSNRTKDTRALTLAFYLLGGLVAAGAINLLQGNKNQPLKNLKKKSWF